MSKRVYGLAHGLDMPRLSDRPTQASVLDSSLSTWDEARFIDKAHQVN